MCIKSVTTNTSSTFKPSPALSNRDAKVRIWDHAVNTHVWGIPEYSASKIAEALLKNTPIRVMKESGQTDENGKPIMIVDQELTAAAIQKADEMKQAITKWGGLGVDG